MWGSIVVAAKNDNEQDIQNQNSAYRVPAHRIFMMMLMHMTHIVHPLGMMSVVICHTVSYVKCPGWIVYRPKSEVLGVCHPHAIS